MRPGGAGLLQSRRELTHIGDQSLRRGQATYVPGGLLGMSLEKVLDNASLVPRLQELLSNGVHITIDVRYVGDKGEKYQSVDFNMCGPKRALERLNDTFLYRYNHANPESVSSVLSYHMRIAEESGRPVSLERVSCPPEAHVCISTLMKRSYYRELKEFVESLGFLLMYGGMAYLSARQFMNPPGMTGSSLLSDVLYAALGVVGAIGLVRRTKSAIDDLRDYVNIKSFVEESPFSSHLTPNELRIANCAFMHVPVPDHLREFYPD